MVRLAEIEGKMNENGCIEIPAIVLEQTGIRIGDNIKLIYMADVESLQNESKEFVLLRKEQETAKELMKEQPVAFQIPLELLEDAGIPLDADLDIVCREQKIIILPAEDVSEIKVPDELLTLCSDLGISEDKVKIILKAAEEETDETSGL